MQRRDAEHESFLAGEEGRVVIAHGGREAVFLEITGHDLATAEAVGEQQGAAFIGAQEILEFLRGDFGAAVNGDGGEGGGGAGGGVFRVTCNPSRPPLVRGGG